jgi:protochlorophyllide reductase
MMKGQSKFGEKKICVITGTSSGLGKMTARALLRTGEYHVVGACRDLEKMAVVAEVEEFDMSSFTAMELDLASFDSVKKFCDDLEVFRCERPLDRVVCNAAVYQPSLDVAKWTVDGHEQQLQINFLSHFLMISKLMPAMKNAQDPRVVTVGSVTGNDNTVGGGGVYPVADLKELEGLAAGASNPVSMIDGYNFNGAKGYKDSKLCLMMLSNLLHEKYHRQTGIAFSSIYPGCIAESPLFREKVRERKFEKRKETGGKRTCYTLRISEFWFSMTSETTAHHSTAFRFRLLVVTWSLLSPSFCLRIPYPHSIYTSGPGSASTSLFS